MVWWPGMLILGLALGFTSIPIWIESAGSLDSLNKEERMMRWWRIPLLIGSGLAFAAMVVMIVFWI